jgi:hypothetical protein
MQKTISLKLPAELHAKLVQLSHNRKLPKSQVVRAALEAYFNQTRGSKPSCAQLAADLVGSLEGPSDLASHPKHLRGYGR